LTPAEFDAACRAYALKYDASETSGRRSVARSILVGGFDGDPHTWGFGRDFIYDHGANRAGAKAHSRSPMSCLGCSDFGLKIIHENSHDHAQPWDFPAGKVTKYPLTEVV
jgi:hypothetical protein